MEFEGIWRRFGLTSRFDGAFGPGFGVCWALGSGGELAGGMFWGHWAGGRPVLGCQSPLPGSTRGNPSHERRVSAGVRVGFAGRFGLLQLNRGHANPVESEVGLGEVEAPAPGGLDQPGDRSDEGSQSVLAGGLGQQVELHGALDQFAAPKN